MYHLYVYVQRVLALKRGVALVALERPLTWTERTDATWDVRRGRTFPSPSRTKRARLLLSSSWKLLSSATAIFASRRLCGSHFAAQSVCLALEIVLLFSPSYFFFSRWRTRASALMSTVKGGEEGTRKKKTRRPTNKTEVKGLCNSFVKPHWLKGLPFKSLPLPRLDFIEHHKIMETFHENMDSGKKKKNTSACLLKLCFGLQTIKKKKCSKYYSRAWLFSPYSASRSSL